MSESVTCFAPWSVTACPKSWGAYGPSRRCEVVLHGDPLPSPAEDGWYIHVAVDDDLAKVDVEAKYIKGPGQGEEQALRKLLPILEALDIEVLTPRQRETRTLAIRMLQEQFS